MIHFNTWGGARWTRRRLGARLAATAPLAAAGAAACGAPGGQSGGPAAGQPGQAARRPAEIAFMANHSADDEPLFQEVFGQLKTKAPEIRVQFTNVTGVNYQEKLVSLAAGGTLPDTYYGRPKDTPPLVQKGMVRALDDFLRRDAREVNVQDWWPSQMGELQFKTRTYHTPYDYSNYGIYYNKTLFDQAGVPYPPPDWAWEQFLDTAKRLARRQGAQPIFGLANLPGDWGLDGWLQAGGGGYFNEARDKCVMTSAPNVAVIQFLADLRLVHGVVPKPGELPPGNAFQNGWAAMEIQGSWATLSYRNAIAEKFPWDVQALPKAKGGKRPVLATGGAWVMAPATKAPEAAWEVLKHVSSKDGIETLISKPLRSVPGRQSAVARWVETARASKAPPEHVQVFPDQMQGSFPNKPVVFWYDFVPINNKYVGEAFTGARTVKEALADLEREANEAIAKYEPGWLQRDRP